MDKLNQAFAKLREEQQGELIRLLRQLPSAVEAARKLVADRHYRVIFSSKDLGRIRSGAAQLGKRAGGLYSANIHDSTGNIISQVSLQEMSPDLLSLVSQFAIQAALAEMMQRLEFIDQKIGDVLQGQRNDRLALIYSAESLCQQAIGAIDSGNRRSILMLAVAQSNEGRQSLLLNLETDIQSLDSMIEKVPRNQLETIAVSLIRNTSNELSKIQNKALAIQEAFQGVLRASHILALSYAALGERESLRISLQPLAEAVRRIGERGEKIARWLPYTPSAPPEELWRSSLLQLESGIIDADRLLGNPNLDTIEISFTPDEVSGGVDT